MILGHEPLNGRTGHEAGRQLLKKLYLQQTGEDLPPIGKGEWGKPFFENSPWYFSISHTRDQVFCVLAKQNVAVDAENLHRKFSPRLPDRVLSPGELAQYEASEDKNRTFLTFWVLKEAAAKLDGRGLRGFPNHTAFTLPDPRVQEIAGCLVAVMTGETYAI